MGGIPQIAKALVAEFFGTYMLCSAVVLQAMNMGPTNIAGGIGIAFTLAVAIYAVGRVSGAHLNPAVTAALVITKKAPIEQLSYMVPQVGAGIVSMMMAQNIYDTPDNMKMSLGGKMQASSAYLSFVDTSGLLPVTFYSDMVAMGVEAIYTAMLCLTVLCCAAAEGAQGNNYYGMAIGFVILAGGYGAGGISGGCFNPAVALGIEMNAVESSGSMPHYLAGEFVGSILAAGMFRLVRPEDFGGSADGILPKAVAEFLGTYYLIVTIGFAVLSGSLGAPIAIGAALMVMIFNMAGVSGANFNPAVTLGLMMSMRGVMDPKTGAIYICTQMAAAAAAALTFMMMMDPEIPGVPSLGMNSGLTAPSTMEMMAAEGMMTMQLVFIVLSTTTIASEAGWPAELSGFVVGGALLASVIGIGGYTGSAINPAVTFGVALADTMNEGSFENMIIYMAVQAGAAAAAMLLFFIVFNDEYGGSAVAAMAVEDWEDEMANSQNEVSAKKSALASSTSSGFSSSASSSASSVSASEE